MPYIPVPDCVKVEMIYQWDGQGVQNVFHVRTPNTINAAELAAVQGIFETWWSGYLRSDQSDTVSIVKYVLTDASSEFGVSQEFAPGGTTTSGFLTSPSLPNNVSLAMKWVTAFRGRSFRGRTYHIGLVESYVAGNVVIPGQVSAMISTYNNLITMLDGSNRELVVVSKFQGNAPRTTAVATQILNVTTDGVIDSQRRRLPGRGA